MSFTPCKALRGSLNRDQAHAQVYTLQGPFWCKAHPTPLRLLPSYTLHVFNHMYELFLSDKGDFIGTANIIFWNNPGGLN